MLRLRSYAHPHFLVFRRKFPNMLVINLFFTVVFSSLIDYLTLLDFLGRPLREPLDSSRTEIYKAHFFFIPATPPPPDPPVLAPRALSSRKSISFFLFSNHLCPDRYFWPSDFPFLVSFYPCAPMMVVRRTRFR